jgi:hypothetical protein
LSQVPNPFTLYIVFESKVSRTLTGLALTCDPPTFTS